MAAPYDVGYGPDAVTLTIGEDTVSTFLSYQIVVSVFDTPGRFALRLGWGDTARDLLRKYSKGDAFQLHIGGIQMMTGTVDALEVPQGEYTEIDIRGRDHTAALQNDYLPEEKSFSEAKYYDLTETMIKEVGMGDWVLTGSNTANRKAITGSTRIRENKAARTTEEIETPVQQAASTTSRVIRKTLKAQLGETRLGFLKRQYKRVGIFLWCGGSGEFILSEPNAHQTAIYRFVRERDVRTDATNITGCRYVDDAAQRHFAAWVHGRKGGGKKGRAKVEAAYVDTELQALGYTNQIHETDTDCKTIKECEFAARRRIAEERRNGWQLSYTVSGHTMLPAGGGSERVVLAPDTVADIDDQEIGIKRQGYIHTVTYIGGKATQTTVDFSRPEDLVFAEEMET